MLRCMIVDSLYYRVLVVERVAFALKYGLMLVIRFESGSGGTKDEFNGV